MREASVTMKDGSRWCGPINYWRPVEGWLSLMGAKVDAGPDKIWLRDVKEATDYGVMTRINVVEDVDLLERAREEGWDGR